VSLRFLCGCLSPGSAVGQGLRPFVVYPSCRGGRFYTTELEEFGNDRDMQTISTGTTDCLDA